MSECRTKYVLHFAVVTTHDSEAQPYSKQYSAKKYTAQGHQIDLKMSLHYQHRDLSQSAIFWGLGNFSDLQTIWTLLRSLKIFVRIILAMLNVRSIGQTEHSSVRRTQAFFRENFLFCLRKLSIPSTYVTKQFLRLQTFKSNLRI